MFRTISLHKEKLKSAVRRGVRLTRLELDTPTILKKFKDDLGFKLASELFEEQPEISQGNTENFLLVLLDNVETDSFWFLGRYINAPQDLG
ncbi:hypothetical protein DPMN_040965 [Dreissena polymorpha]|uniref:Uncharacterized protein n=1 Tax=Dreissena polymorpha TaxID=45954 RepID=A0A9D4CYI9_DREPO|nr:hypothetical protein DPMN_040965 [Dreissena polymorpha]